MLKTLYLARHAKSSWKESHLSDFDRPLNKRGRRDAPRMAAVLKSLGVAPQLILSSPAIRARTTAEIYQDALGGTLRYEQMIYEASVSTLLTLLGEKFMHTDAMMLIGHNPDLTFLNAKLNDHSIANIPTAGVVGIHFERELCEGKGSGYLYVYPKQYAWAQNR